MLDFSTTAFLFPGQGSQAVGMGKDLAEAYPIAKATFEEADDIMGVALSNMMFEGPDDALGDTAITQPAMYVHSVALLRVLWDIIPDAKPAFVAGHSLGEFTALTAAGTLDFAEGVALVQKRGEAMKLAGEQQPGGMAALLGLSIEATDTVIAEASASGIIVIANDNCPGQVVISGEQSALDVAVEIAKDKGAKRAIPLDVSVATHSPLMQPAKEAFVEALANITLFAPTMPIYQNVSAQAETDLTKIKENLELQIVSSVRWRESMNAMIEDGAETFVEVGSKSVLTGLLRRIDRSKDRINVE
ncbi:MAG: ACP S-malonyltransferase, partial [Chloroflexota bacterium]